MSLRSSVTLSRAWITLAATPATGINCGTSGAVGGGGQRSEAFTQEGSFRTYANNVTRLILGQAQTRVLNLTLRALTPAQITTLASMVGKTCLFRDTYGRRFFGSFLITTATDIPLSGLAKVDLQTDVAINFQQVSYTEGV